MRPRSKVIAVVAALYLCTGIVNTLRELNAGGYQRVVAILYLACIALGVVGCAAAFWGKLSLFRAAGLIATGIPAIVYVSPQIRFFFQGFLDYRVLLGQTYSFGKSYVGGISAVPAALYVAIWTLTRTRPAAAEPEGQIGEQARGTQVPETVTNDGKIAGVVAAAYLAAGMPSVLAGFAPPAGQRFVSLVYLICIVLGVLAAIGALAGKRSFFRLAGLVATGIPAIVYESPRINFLFKGLVRLYLPLWENYISGRGYMRGINVLPVILFAAIWAATKRKSIDSGPERQDAAGE